MKDLERAVKLIAILIAGVLWRVAGLKAAGRALIAASAEEGDENEQTRMLAVIPLVKAGRRTIDLIARAAADDRLPPAAVRLFAEIDDPRSRPMLEAMAAGDGLRAEAAGEVLEALDRMEGAGGG